MTTSLTFSEHELTGARITVPFTSLRRLGPKHHAIVVGTCDDDDDDEIWIAELSLRNGYRLVSLNQWLDDNGQFVEGMKIETNTGPRSNWDVAQSAIDEIETATKNGRKYHVVLNNCETFADRHVQGRCAGLSPQVKKTVRLMGFVIAGGALVLKRHLQRDANNSQS